MGVLSDLPIYLKFSQIQKHAHHLLCAFYTCSLLVGHASSLHGRSVFVVVPRFCARASSSNGRTLGWR
eukprot:5601781-Pyramimonas_sp.AAC.1